MFKGFNQDTGGGHLHLITLIIKWFYWGCNRMSILKVGTIQDQSNSNTAISIDNSGRVNIPKIPAFQEDTEHCQYPHL